MIDFWREVRFIMPTMFVRFFGLLCAVAVVEVAVGAEKEAKAKPAKVDFVKQIQPILEFNCVGCHRKDRAKKNGGGYQIDERETAFEGGDEGTGVTPGKPAESTLYELMTLPLDDEVVMPPKDKDQRPTKEEIALVKLWIEQGAYWPKGLVLKPRKKTQLAQDEGEIVDACYSLVMEKFKPVTESQMKVYSTTLKDERGQETLVSFEMLPLKGGTFTMGSPAGEAGRKADEGPQRRVKVSPFWMGKTEVTWDEYHKFMYWDRDKALVGKEDDSRSWYLAWTSTPTKPYVNMDFGMGTGQHPAICMTQHAANKYCQWLTAQTGIFYRLPTEAEWEYACRAGSETAYSWGDKADAGTVGKHAWHKNNSMDPINFVPKYQKVAKKAPNAWGLFDIHGNVSEWVMDAYAPYQSAKGVLVDPWVKAKALYPRVVRGGSYDPFMKFVDLRSAARVASHKDWKMQDPQLPKSIWYHTDARFVGFRIVRPLKVPSKEQMMEYWNMGRPKDVIE